MTASLPVSSFFVDKNDVFERAIRQLARDIYERHSPTHRVTKETVGHFVKELSEKEGFGNSLPPEVVIKSRGEYEAVMDAKWTMTGPKMDHFYQAVTYMTVMQVDIGVLVYPELDEDHPRASHQVQHLLAQQSNRRPTSPAANTSSASWNTTPSPGASASYSALFRLLSSW